MIVVDITDFTPDDIDEFLKIEKQSFKVPWTRDIVLFDLFCRFDTVKYIAAKYKGKLVGYGVIEIVDKKAHILNIAVSPDYRGYGIGEQLLVAMLEYAEFKGCENVYLEVRVSNKVAISLYSKWGFKISDVIVNYYKDGESALVMSKKL